MRSGPKHIPVVWVNWGVRKDLLNIRPSLRHAHNPRGDEPGLARAGAGHPLRSDAQAGSWGAEVVDEINPGEQDIQVIKHRFSGVLGHRDGRDAAQHGHQDAVHRRRQHGPVRDDHARGRKLPRLRHHPDRRRHGHDVARYCVQATLYNVRLLFGFVTRSAAILAALLARRREFQRSSNRPTAARRWDRTAAGADADRQFRCHAAAHGDSSISPARSANGTATCVRRQGRRELRPARPDTRRAVCGLNLIAALQLRLRRHAGSRVASACGSAASSTAPAISRTCRRSSTARRI